MMRATVRVLGGHKYPSGMGSPELAVEVAQTPEELRAGLGGRTALEPSHDPWVQTGMLFDMGCSDVHGFHMVGVQFSLDILFVHATGHIQGIAHQAQPGDPGPILSPRGCRWVVEAPGGWAREHGVQDWMLISVFLV